MQTISIPKYRIVPAITGIGWVTVQEWNGNEYVKSFTCRDSDQAHEYIASMETVTNTDETPC